MNERWLLMLEGQRCQFALCVFICLGWSLWVMELWVTLACTTEFAWSPETSASATEGGEFAVCCWVSSAGEAEGQVMNVVP
jgi:hypothetical protein